ncbi:MAG: DUF3460 family protein, partial [Polymorphobacter sp.]
MRGHSLRCAPAEATVMLRRGFSVTIRVQQTENNKMYQSEFTRFMDGFLEKHPEVDTERRELRLTWW